MSVQTYWNGEPCEAWKVWLVVPEWAEGDPELAWWRDLAGERRPAVEVVYNGETFYLDDGEHTASEEAQRRFRERFGDKRGMLLGRVAGMGWAKVTDGRGSPAYAHANLPAVPGSVEAR